MKVTYLSLNIIGRHPTWDWNGVVSFIAPETKVIREQPNNLLASDLSSVGIDRYKDDWDSMFDSLTYPKV